MLGVSSGRFPALYAELYVGMSVRGAMTGEVRGCMIVDGARNHNVMKEMRIY